MSKPGGATTSVIPVSSGIEPPSGDITVTFEDTLDVAVWSDLATRVRPSLRFLAHGWWQAWADAMLPYDSWRGPLRLMVARSGDGTVQAVLPLAEQVMLGLSVLSLAGNYKPFRSLLIAEDAPPATTTALVDFLGEEAGAKAFRFGPVETSQPEIQALKQALDDKGWKFCLINGGEDHLIDLPADLESYRDMVSKRKFQRIGYQKRRMGREGNVRDVRYQGGDADSWERAIADLAKVERASWLVERGGDLSYADPKQADFWRRYLSDASASRCASIWMMYIDDRPVCFNAVLDSGDHRYGLSGHYDEVMKTYSPGKVVDLDAIVSAFDEGITTFNLGQGDSGYKANFGANRIEPIEDWLALPPTAAGRLLHLAARAKFGSAS